MREAKRNPDTESGSHNAVGELRKLYLHQPDNLYLLSLLLTADKDKAETCIFSVSAIEDFGSANPLFRTWARASAGLAVIKNAIRMIIRSPDCERRDSNALNSEIQGRAFHPAFEGVLKLSDFERFAVVLSVFERYSDQGCSELPGCSAEDLQTARTRALEKLSIDRSFDCSK